MILELYVWLALRFKSAFPDHKLATPQDDSPQTVTSKLSTGASKSVYQHVREPLRFSKN